MDQKGKKSTKTGQVVSDNQGKEAIPPQLPWAKSRFGQSKNSFKNSNYSVRPDQYHGSRHRG